MCITRVRPRAQGSAAHARTGSTGGSNTLVQEEDIVKPPKCICTRRIVVQTDGVLALPRALPDDIDTDDLMYR